MKTYKICITYLDTVEARNEEEAIQKALEAIGLFPDTYNDIEIEEEVEGK